MGRILYIFPSSAPCQAVMATFKALDMEYDLYVLDYNKKEHLSEHYLKMNPQHVAPLLDDGGFFIWDSHAINGYLIDKYRENDPLYPKDSQKRAIINQRLYFESGLLFPHLENIAIKIMSDQKVEPEDIADVMTDYSFLEAFLSRGTKYIASDNITIADFSILPSLLALNLVVPALNNENYPKIMAYLDRCKTNVIGFEETFGKGLQQFITFIKKYNYNVA